jgi:hypothetical protein
VNHDGGRPLSLNKNPPVKRVSFPAGILLPFLKISVLWLKMKTVAQRPITMNATVNVAEAGLSDGLTDQQRSQKSRSRCVLGGLLLSAGLLACAGITSVRQMSATREIQIKSLQLATNNNIELNLLNTYEYSSVPKYQPLSELEIKAEFENYKVKFNKQVQIQL